MLDKIWLNFAKLYSGFVFIDLGRILVHNAWAEQKIVQSLYAEEKSP